MTLTMVAVVLAAFLLAGLIAAGLYLRRGGVAPTPFKDFPAEFADDKGWRLRYHKSGRGPYLLLLHGIGANLYCWRWIVPFLNKHFTVIALDLPGFGQSSILEGAAYGLDDQTPRVMAFLDLLGIAKTYVVGNSMGGNIALWMALLYPDRIAGCGVIAPATSRWLVRVSMRKWLWLSQPVSLLLTRQAMDWAHRR